MVTKLYGIHSLVADPGGAGGGLVSPAHLFLDQTEAPRAEKRIFGDRAPSLF